MQNASQEQALLAYRATMLIALQDVENALVAYAKEQQRANRSADAVAANRRAVELSTQLYTRREDRLPQRADGPAVAVRRRRTRWSGATANVATNLVALYKALGGGWENAEDRPVE